MIPPHRLSAAVLPALVFLVLGLSGAAATTAAPRQAERELVWREGEDAAATTLNGHGWYSSSGIRADWLSPGEPGSRDGAWLAHDSTTGATAEAEHRFDIRHAGSYTFRPRPSPTCPSFAAWTPWRKTRPAVPGEQARPAAPWPRRPRPSPWAG